MLTTRRRASARTRAGTSGRQLGSGVSTGCGKRKLQLSGAASLDLQAALALCLRLEATRLATLQRGRGRWQLAGLLPTSRPGCLAWRSPSPCPSVQPRLQPPKLIGRCAAAISRRLATRPRFVVSTSARSLRGDLAWPTEPAGHLERPPSTPSTPTNSLPPLSLRSTLRASPSRHDQAPYRTGDCLGGRLSAAALEALPAAVGAVASTWPMHSGRLTSNCV